ncbi:MAG: hypothetical protein IJ309_04835 [Clostridia bacterium]|nr:hypothetical protein [Clostridia bacterium]
MDIKNQQRRLFKERYIRGTIRTASGEGRASVASSSGIGLESLIIKGKTLHREKSPTERVRTLLENGSYIPAGVTGAYAYALPDGFAQSQLSFVPSLSAETTGISVLLADSSSLLFSNSVELLSTQGSVNSFSGSGYGYIIVNGALTDEELSALWQNLSIEVSIIGDYAANSEYEVVNAGDNGLLVRLTSKNLLDHKKLKASALFNVVGLPKGEYYGVTGVPTKTSYIAPFSSMVDSPASMTRDMIGKSLSYITFYEGGYGARKAEVGLYDSTNKLKSKWGNMKRDLPYTYLEPEGRDKFHIRVNYTTGEEIDEVFRFMAMEGECSSIPEFVPFFEPTEVQLPTQATDKQGRIVSLSFAGYGDNCDCLVVSRQGRKVVYYQHVAEQNPGLPQEEQTILDEPVAYDLSSCDFARQLFDLDVPYNNSGVLYAKGAGLVEVKYYATRGQDQVTLSIKYACQGDEIGQSKTFNVRKGCRVDIIAPHISGYTPLKRSVSLAPRENTEMILEYRKDE